MANESVATIPNDAPLCLSIGAANHAQDLCTQLRAMLACIGAASSSPEINDDSVINACQGTETLIGELEKIIWARQPTTAKVTA